MKISSVNNFGINNYNNAKNAKNNVKFGSYIPVRIIAKEGKNIVRSPRGRALKYCGEQIAKRFEKLAEEVGKYDKDYAKDPRVAYFVTRDNFLYLLTGKDADRIYKSTNASVDNAKRIIKKAREACNSDIAPITGSNGMKLGLEATFSTNSGHSFEYQNARLVAIRGDLLAFCNTGKNRR